MEGNEERERGRKNLEKSIVADLPVSCPLSCVNIFGRHRVDAGKRVGVCDCPVCQPQSIRHLSVRARVSHAHAIPPLHTHARVHSAPAPSRLLFLLSSPSSAADDRQKKKRRRKKTRERPRETMPRRRRRRRRSFSPLESREANDRGIPEKLIAGWPSTHRTFEMSSSRT